MKHTFSLKKILWKSSLAASVATIALIQPASATEDASDDTDFLFDEIVITASRREQSLQDVPASVAVIDTTKFSAIGLDDVGTQLGYVAAVDVSGQDAPGRATITFRGVAQYASGATIGTYVDDVPYGVSGVYNDGAARQLDPGLLDIERVEVIRGPQGTLFGASAAGGIIRYVLKDPSAEYAGGSVRVGVSNLAHGGFGHQYTAKVNTPIVTDVVGISASAYYRKIGGYLDFADGSKSNVNDGKSYGGLVNIVSHPSDNSTLKLFFLHQRNSSDYANSILVNLEDPDSLHNNQRYSGIDDVPISGNRPVFSVANVTLEYEFDTFSLNATSSYQGTRAPTALEPSGVFFFPGFSETNQYSSDRYTQELRLTSTNSGAFEWIAGLYYTEDNGFREQNIAMSDQPFVVLQADNLFKEYAAYGNATYYISDKWDVTVGVRYAHDDVGAAVNVPVDVLGTGIQPSTLEESLNQQNIVTWLFNTRYRPNDSISLYARAASGYRPAVINPPFFSGPILAEADFLWSYELGVKGSITDTLNLDVSLYHIDWQDTQITGTAVTADGRGVSVLINAESGLKVDGIEATASWRPSPAFNVEATGSYTDSRIREDDAAIGALKGERPQYVAEWQFSLKADYNKPINDNMVLVAGAGLRYSSDVKTGFFGGIGENGELFESGDLAAELNGNAIVDAHVGLEFGENYKLTLYATNLFDRYGYTNGNFVGIELYQNRTLLQPRRVGLNFSADF